MSLQLDERQRAMLAEMGLPVFFPPSREDADEAEAEVETVEAAVAVDLKAPPPVRSAPAQVPAPHATSSSGRTLAGHGDAQPDWLIVGDADDDDTELRREPFAGDPGVLLDNMLKALGVARGRKVHLLHVTRQAQGDPALRELVARLQPKVIVVMGRFAPQVMLATDEPIGRLRGRAHDFAGVPLVVTYPPIFLLRNLQEKAKAWADLCLALGLLAQRQG